MIQGMGSIKSRPRSGGFCGKLSWQFEVVCTSHSVVASSAVRLLAESRSCNFTGADACARTAALTGTMDIALPDARDPFHNFCWLLLKSSHGRNCEPHHCHTAPIHYLTNLRDVDELKTHMHKRHKLGPADTSGYYYNSWQRLKYASQPTLRKGPLTSKFARVSPEVPQNYTSYS
eukprot:1156238-Pelagomonas_calceolata.AAC.3